MYNNIYVYGNGSAGNHGCEALFRSISEILAPIGQACHYSLNCEEDAYYNLDKIAPFRPLTPKVANAGIGDLIYRIKQHFRYSDERYYNRLYSQFFKDIIPGAVYLSAGGDNYSYGFSTWLECLNKGINSHGGKTALLGCSILENIADKKMIEDLSLYHTIIARESLTYSALINAGINNNIYLCPDPAFQLCPKFLPFPKGFAEGNTVGINVSPLIIEREAKNDILLSNFVELIKFIISQTDMQVALIPHVVWSRNDDRKPLQRLYDMFKETKRVVMIEDHNAEELKGFIARCRFMVAARTHASIAAYSQSVPTLVIGYSVKSKGIAKDIFGEYNGYVLPVENVHNNCDLTKAFAELMNREEHIRKVYLDVMPSYKNKVSGIADAVKSMLTL